MKIKLRSLHLTLLAFTHTPMELKLLRSLLHSSPLSQTPVMNHGPPHFSPTTFAQARQHPHISVVIPPIRFWELKENNLRSALFIYSMCC